jgi:hypothetical protein
MLVLRIKAQWSLTSLTGGRCYKATRFVSQTIVITNMLRYTHNNTESTPLTHTTATSVNVRDYL